MSRNIEQTAGRFLEQSAQGQSISQEMNAMSPQEQRQVFQAMRAGQKADTKNFGNIQLIDLNNDGILDDVKTTFNDGQKDRRQVDVFDNRQNEKNVEFIMKDPSILLERAKNGKPLGEFYDLLNEDQHTEVTAKLAKLAKENPKYSDIEIKTENGYLADVKVKTATGKIDVFDSQGERSVQDNQAEYLLRKAAKGESIQELNEKPVEEQKKIFEGMQRVIGRDPQDFSNLTVIDANGDGILDDVSALVKNRTVSVDVYDNTKSEGLKDLIRKDPSVLLDRALKGQSISEYFDLFGTVKDEVTQKFLVHDLMEIQKQNPKYKDIQITPTPGDERLQDVKVKMPNGEVVDVYDMPEYRSKKPYHYYGTK